jgi:alcohol dehydrogenase class IV
MTTNHEMAHQVASETECNFIGFLASIKMIIYTFNIQGTAMPYDIASDLQGTDEKSFDQILKQFIRNIKKLSGKYKFQKEYETPIETGFSLFYDQF